MNRPSKPRTAEELEEIHAEGRDWYAEGYEFAEQYVGDWKQGKIALGKPIEEQPQTPFANRKWREGFNARIHQHLMQTLSRHGLQNGPQEVRRWESGIEHALTAGANGSQS